MDQSMQDAVSIQDILSRALVFCQDEDYRNGFTKGFYIALIQLALEELAFDTFYQVVTDDIDLSVTDFKTCFQMEVPANIFNIREIYFFNGSCAQPEGQVQVYWKRLFNNGKGGTNYTAKNNDMGGSAIDPYYPLAYVGANVYYANIFNGLMMFSRNSTGFKYLRVVGNGAGTPIGDDPVIPKFFRTAITDYVCESYFRTQMTKDRAYAQDWRIYYDRLHNEKNGSWHIAEKRAKKLSTWKKDTIRETNPLWAANSNYFIGPR